MNSIYDQIGEACKQFGERVGASLKEANDLMATNSRKERGMNENLANEIRKTIESIKDMKTQASGINNYLSILEGLVRTDYQKQVDEAYQRGYKACMKENDFDSPYTSCEEYEDAFRGISVYSMSENKKLMVDFVALEELEDAQKEIDEAYQRGLEDAWEAARRVAFNPHIGGLSVEDLEKAFDCLVPQQVFKNYTAQQTIEKLKAYEEKQNADDKIEVRDEVVWTEDENVVIVVTSIYTTDNMEWCDGFCKDGKVYSILTKNARKTGNHYDIDKILEDMRK